MNQPLIKNQSSNSQHSTNNYKFAFFSAEPDSTNPNCSYKSSCQTFKFVLTRGRSIIATFCNINIQYFFLSHCTNNGALELLLLMMADHSTHTCILQKTCFLTFFFLSTSALNRCTAAANEKLRYSFPNGVNPLPLFF